MKIAIVGLGYVGLPLAIQFASSNVNVIGLDVDKTKVDLINDGQSYIKHIAAETIAEAGKMKRLCASIDFSRVKEVEAVIICVPTPLSRNREPDISFILETGQSDRVAFNKRDTGRAGIDDLSRNDRRRFARCLGGRFAHESGRGFPFGFLT